MDEHAAATVRVRARSWMDCDSMLSPARNGPVLAPKLVTSWLIGQLLRVNPVLTLGDRSDILALLVVDGLFILGQRGRLHTLPMAACHCSAIRRQGCRLP